MMTKSIQKKLLAWFLEHKREMPWRENPTPYRVWISEIMLQQTTVATVKSFYIRFMERFPDLESLSKAEEDEVLRLWAGLGYYSRARNILKTAQLLKQESNFPCEFEDLKKLPGIGPYTAGAISSLAFNQKTSLIDTNVDRVLGRFFTLNRLDPNFETTLRQQAQLLIEEVDDTYVWAWNQALMELGALICGVKKAQCTLCPLVDECKAYLDGNPLKFPGDKIKVLLNNIIEYAYIVRKDNKFIISKIVQGTKRVGLYDFPIYNQARGQEISRMNYRISNNKVCRIHCLVPFEEYDCQQDEFLVEKENILSDYALVSPCKKFLQKT